LTVSREIQRCVIISVEYRQQSLFVPLGEGFGLVVTDMTNWMRLIDGSREIHAAGCPAIAVAGPVLGRDRSALRQPAPSALRPQLCTLVATVADELQVAGVGNRIAVDQERAQVDLVQRPLVVVSGAPVVRSNREGATGEADHGLARGVAGGKGTRAGSLVGLSLFQLQ